MTQRGLVESVGVEDVRSFLAAPVVPADTTLLVNEGSVFMGPGAQAEIGGAVLDVEAVIAGAGPDDPDAVVLSSAAGVAVDAGEPVTALPLTTYTRASVVLDGEVEPVSVLVDQDFQSKVAMQPGNVYYGDDRPVVTVDLVNGQMVVVGVDGRGADDASNLAGELPQEIKDQVEAGAPVAPASSPLPALNGFAGVILTRWVGVLNPTPVMYDVHVSASNAVAPSESTLLDSVASTVTSIRTLADDTALAYDTTYYVAIWARSGNELAASPSAWVAGVMDRTQSADLAADAIDGFTITGATIRTASAGAREQIETSQGYRSFDSAGEVQTQIRAGRLVTSDGQFSGTVEGSNITGGAISIANSVDLELNDDFSAGGGSGQPVGWGRLNTSSQVPSAGAFFDTSGGSPGGRLRLQLKPNAEGKSTLHSVWPADLTVQDMLIAFDYRWDGNWIGGLFPTPGAAVVLREPADTAGVGSGLRIVLEDGGIAVMSGSDTVAEPIGYVQAFAEAQSTGAQKGVWHRVEVKLQGATVAVRAYPKSQATPPDWSFGTIENAYPQEGDVTFCVAASGAFGAAGGQDQAISLDNLYIAALSSGFSVTPDGTATVGYPTLAGSIANKAYVDDEIDKAAGAQDREDISAYGVSGRIQTLDIRRIGKLREIRGRAFFTLPSGTSTDVTSALPVGDRPSRVVFQVLFMGNADIGAAFIRDTGVIALNNPRNSSAGGAHQFSLTYTVD